jgi:effector-binding domain-containing protein
MKVILQIIVIALLSISAGEVVATEEAPFELVTADGKFEIRDYAGQVVAEVWVEGEFEDVGNVAFRKLFGYISGDNQVRQDIAMTAPVAQEKRSENIAMTSPVGQRAAGEGWAVSFMMPSELTLKTTPEPTDPAVTIRAIPERRMATIRYSGRWTEKNFRKNLSALQTWVEEQGLAVTGDPVWARYNAPFVPPFWRRNEIMIPVSG